MFARKISGHCLRACLKRVFKRSNNLSSVPVPFRILRQRALAGCQQREVVYVHFNTCEPADLRKSTEQRVQYIGREYRQHLGNSDTGSPQRDIKEHLPTCVSNVMLLRGRCCRHGTCAEASPHANLQFIAHTQCPHLLKKKKKNASSEAVPQ